MYVYVHVQVLSCLLACLVFLLIPQISHQVLAVMWLWLTFFSWSEAAQITGKKACERMKDAIRRGVERQVAEGLFERAQERMWHQFRQLKVFCICRGTSSPGEERWEAGTGQIVDSWTGKSWVPSAPGLAYGHSAQRLFFPTTKHWCCVTGL